ncbi:MAG TPA: NADP-dependent oxidoreductase [Ktedonobacteraceae bacterium]|nr:NADP-dependent oxidoreductase [Ktedonobacteraceae bacterium]
MSTRTMHAIQVHDYGDADQLKLEEIPVPEPGEGEVLVRVYAAGVNPADWKVRSGYFKAFSPTTFPYIPGADLAGVVEKVGPGVSTFQPGQEVFGRSSNGSYAEYAIAPANRLALKPKTLNFDEAATVPVGATTAWQGIFDHGHLQPGQRVLILGGAGGVGLFAVQFARWKGAHVIATASTGNADFVRSLGAETVVDYTKTRVGDAVHDVDLVFDTVGGDALASTYPTLKRGGTLVSIAGQPDEARLRELGVHAARFSAQVNTELLNTFAQLIDEGKIKPVVGPVFSLGEAGKAQELSQRGHGRGRIILHMAG